MNFNCGPDKCYTQLLCDSDYSSRINGLILAKKNYALDKTSLDNFLQSVWEGVLSGDVKTILKIRGEKPRPETAELEGFGNQSIKVGNTNHTINFVDESIKDNQEFYNAIRFQGSKFDLYYLTKELIFDASGNQITLYGDAVHTAGATDLLMGEGTLKWVQKGSPLAIFDEFDSDNFLEGLFYEIESTNYPNFQVSLLENATVNIQQTADLNQAVYNNCDKIWSIEVEPNDIATVTVNATTGTITVQGAENGSGTFEITAKVENDCGGCVYGISVYTVTIQST
jgi:hypothetical protein